MAEPVCEVKALRVGDIRENPICGGTSYISESQLSAGGVPILMRNMRERGGTLVWWVPWGSLFNLNFFSNFRLGVSSQVRVEWVVLANARYSADEIRALFSLLCSFDSNLSHHYTSPHHFKRHRYEFAVLLYYPSAWVFHLSTSTYAWWDVDCHTR